MGILDFFRDGRWKELDKVLDESFSRVRKDTYNIAQWLKYLRQKDIQNDVRHQKISQKLEAQDEKIRQLQLELSMLKSGLDSVRISASKSSPFPDQVRTKSVPKSEPNSSQRFEHRIIAQMRPVKKEYVLQQILNLVEKESYTTKQVETITVKEKMLCGRTAFYDYLRELKHRGLITESKSGSRRLLASSHRR